MRWQAAQPLFLSWLCSVARTTLEQAALLIFGVSRRRCDWGQRRKHRRQVAAPAAPDYFSLLSFSVGPKAPPPPAAAQRRLRPPTPHLRPRINSHLATSRIPISPQAWICIRSPQGCVSGPKFAYFPQGSLAFLVCATEGSLKFSQLNLKIWPLEVNKIRRPKLWPAPGAKFLFICARECNRLLRHRSNYRGGRVNSEFLYAFMSKFKSNFVQTHCIASFTQLIASRTIDWLARGDWPCLPWHQPKRVKVLGHCGPPLGQSGSREWHGAGRIFCVLAAMENQDPEYKPTEKQLRSVPQLPVRTQPTTAQMMVNVFQFPIPRIKLFLPKTTNVSHETINLLGTSEYIILKIKTLR